MCLSEKTAAILLLQQDENRASRRGWRSGGEREGGSEREREGERDFVLVATSLFHVERKTAARRRGFGHVCFSPTCECIQALSSARPPFILLFSISFSLPLPLSLISRFSPFLHNRSSNMDAENVIEFLGLCAQRFDVCRRLLGVWRRREVAKNGLEKTITKQMLFSKVLVRNSSYKYFFFACYSNHIGYCKGPYRNRNTHNYGWYWYRYIYTLQHIFTGSS